MNGIIYYTKIRDEYSGKNMEHMIGEKLLEIGLEREYGRKLAFEPRAKGEHGKPFFTLLPKIHYNISHSGKYVMCLFAGEEVGIAGSLYQMDGRRIVQRFKDDSHGQRKLHDAGNGTGIQRRSLVKR